MLAQILKERILQADSELNVGLIAKARALAGLLSADPAQPPSPEAAVAAKQQRYPLLVLLNGRVRYSERTSRSRRRSTATGTTWVWGSAIRPFPTLP